ncbi:hypothetical protein XPA_002965 [Xanthoria parietina]
MKTPPTPVSPASVNVHFRLDRIVEEYSSMTTIPSIITVLRASPADDRVFQQLMSNDYRRLQQRSSDLEDHEINIFEAAFLRLMGDAANHPGALAIYVDEILGMKTLTDNEKLRTMKKAIHMQTLLLNMAFKHPSAYQNPHTRARNSGPTAQEASIGQQIFSSIQHPTPQATVRNDSLSRDREPRLPAFDGSNESTSTRAMDDPKLTELLAVYREAKSHLKATEQKTGAYFTLAKILSSKAKDCIQYMMKVKAGDARLVELRNTLERVSGGGTWEAQGTKRRREYDRVDSL